jgi:UDP-glucose 4-epimerase
MRILVTGGAGYIGSHTCVCLLEQGHKVIVVDSLVNSKQESLRRVASLTGQTIDFHQIDLLDAVALHQLFDQTPIEAVIHFAGLKAVGESVQQPLRYYQNNIQGTMNLLEAMQKHHIYQLIFSSSATVYGDPKVVPVTEDEPLKVANPYGRTKLMIEDILRDVGAVDKRWRVALLRYFNPVGAHPSGQIGEDPQGVPNNLLPFVTQVAVGKLPVLKIFGDDYATPDGTCVRDYLHVMDLAEGHTAALQYVQENQGVRAFNLGTGSGKSVLEVIAAFEEATGLTIARQFAPRRAGDVASCYADASRAACELHWKAKRTMVEMCSDAWRWQSQYPNGYSGAVIDIESNNIE